MALSVPIKSAVRSYRCCLHLAFVVDGRICFVDFGLSYAKNRQSEEKNLFSLFQKTSQPKLIHTTRQSLCIVFFPSSLLLLLLCCYCAVCKSVCRRACSRSTCTLSHTHAHARWQWILDLNLYWNRQIVLDFCVLRLVFDCLLPLLLLYSCLFCDFYI